jgi:uncharacterized membrane protein YecN with MAPEG domain
MEAFAVEALRVVNFVSLLLFLVLLGATLASMIRRVRLYRIAGERLPVILKRGLVLFAALTLMGGEAALLRVLGVSLADDAVLRLVYTVQSNVILLSALAYFAKTDLFDIDNPEKP